MAGPFDRPLRHVTPGSPVSAANTSAASRELEARTNYLNARLDAAAAGEALFRYDAVVDPALEVGQPVYWNAANSRYEAAQLAIGTDEHGRFAVLDSADVAGIVYAKTGAATATLLTDGTARIASLTAAVDGTLTPGRYFLSVTAGKMSTARATPAVCILRVLATEDACDTRPLIQMVRGADDLLADHVHYRFDLYTQPAGDYVPPSEGDPHEITDGDAELPGWLPADDESLDERAPAGAKFGYNLAMHPALRAIWPPFPLESVVVAWDKGDGYGSALISSSADNPPIVVDEYGIWWMSDCYGDVPWPIDYGTSESLSVSEAECPRLTEMQLTLFCIQMLTANPNTVVTSLRSAEDSPIVVTDLAGDPATTGNLQIGFDPTLTEDENEAYGGQVLKTLTGQPFGYSRGYVAEGLYTSNPRITLTSDRQRRLTPGNSATPWVHQGKIEIDVDVEPGDRMLAPVTSYLAGVRQDEYQGISYLAFPNGQTSTVRYTFHVPYDGLPDSPEFTLRLRVFGLANGPMSNLALGYKRLTTPAVSGTTLPASFTAGTIDLETASTGVLAGKELSVDSTAFVIAAGDTLVVELTRTSAASPSYAASIGLLRVDGLITAG